MEIRLSDIFGFSEIGQKENQEDYLWPNLKDGHSTFNRVMVLCDGMGGHEKGEVASKCIAESFGKPLEKVNIQSMEYAKHGLSSIYQSACDNLLTLCDDISNPKSMGTTLTCLFPCTDGILMAHIGDSRIYQLRQGSGIIFRTRDHSVVSELIVAGEMTEEEARKSPIRNQLTRAIQVGMANLIQPTYDEIEDIRQGDVFLLCSDGVVEEVSDRELQNLMIGKLPLSERIEKLRKLCLERNTKDNYSCMAIEVSNGVAHSKLTFFQRVAKALNL